MTLKNSHIQIAIAAGISILAFACCSAWVLPRPIDELLLTIPPLIEVVYEALSNKYKGAKFLKTWYWVCAIIFSTAFLIILHLV